MFLSMRACVATGTRAATKARSRLASAGSAPVSKKRAAIDAAAPAPNSGSTWAQWASMKSSAAAGWRSPTLRIRRLATVAGGSPETASANARPACTGSRAVPSSS